MVGFAILTAAVYLIVHVVRSALREAARVPDARQDAFSVDAIIALDEELLVLVGAPGGRCRWLHCHSAVPAVMMLARWRDSHAPLRVTEDDNATIVCPPTEQIGLRFRNQPGPQPIELWRAGL